MSNVDGVENQQLQHGVQVGSGAAPVFEKFAPARSATATADPEVIEANSRYLSMMDPGLIKQYEALPVEQRLAPDTSTPLRAPVSGSTQPDVDLPEIRDNEVLLSDGRIVEVMEVSPRHEQAVEKVLGQSGLSLQGMGALGYQRGMALCSLYGVRQWDRRTGAVGDQEPLIVPRTRLMYEERLDWVGLAKDSARIIKKYNELNGNTEE